MRILSYLKRFFVQLGDVVFSDVPNTIYSIRFENVAKYTRPKWLRWIPHYAYIIDRNMYMQDVSLNFPRDLVILEGIFVTTYGDVKIEIDGRLFLFGDFVVSTERGHMLHVVH